MAVKKIVEQQLYVKDRARLEVEAAFLAERLVVVDSLLQKDVLVGPPATTEDVSWVRDLARRDDLQAAFESFHKGTMRVSYQFPTSLLPPSPSRPKPPPDILDWSVDELEISVRASNCMHYHAARVFGDSIHTVRQLVQKTEAEMLRVPHFGLKTLREVRDELAKYGLTFGMKLPDGDRRGRLRL